MVVLGIIIILLLVGLVLLNLYIYIQISAYLMELECKIDDIQDELNK